jgi:hypothetical protein
MLRIRRGLVVYQLLLILLGLALLIWLIFVFVSRSGNEPITAPADTSVVDTAPIPVPSLPADTSAISADTGSE